MTTRRVGAATSAGRTLVAAETWSRAIELGARGRYAEAEAALTTLTDRHDRWSSLALSTLASHRRQVGETGEAARLDREARERATDAESRADALIGIAADAVAAGDPASAGTAHIDAERDAASTWRTRTRWHWVGAELALLLGDADAAIRHARDALAACAGMSDRHEAKSRIVLAAATGDISALPEVASTLRSRGWLTLEWPLALVAADHGPDVPAPWVAQAWAAGGEATYSIEELLPVGLASAWRAHPGVRRLREERPPPGGE